MNHVNWQSFGGDHALGRIIIFTDNDNTANETRAILYRHIPRGSSCHWIRKICDDNLPTEVAIAKQSPTYIFDLNNGSSESMCYLLCSGNKCFNRDKVSYIQNELNRNGIGFSVISVPPPLLSCDEDIDLFCKYYCKDMNTVCQFCGIGCNCCSMQLK